MTTSATIEGTQSNFSSPGFFLFRPWSHTDKRHVLKLLSPSFGKKSLVKKALANSSAPGAQSCFLEPVEGLDFDEVHLSDKTRVEKILSPDFAGLKPKHFQFVSVSWAPDSPRQLRVESRPMVLRRDAYLFALTEGDICMDKRRIFCVMTLLSPKTARLSP